MPIVIMEFNAKNNTSVNHQTKYNIKIRINQFKKDFIKFNWVNTNTLNNHSEYKKGINEILKNELHKRRLYINR